MDANAVIDYITRTFKGITTIEHSDNRFFYYNPDPSQPLGQRLPFVTLVMNDAYDQVSQLDRPGVFRLNIGVRHETYRAMFDSQPSSPGKVGIIDTGHDYTALDRIMPHPVYASMFWVCVLTPSEATFERVRPLLEEAYVIDVRRYEARANRASSRSGTSST